MYNDQKTSKDRLGSNIILYVVLGVWITVIVGALVFNADTFIEWVSELFV